MENAGIFFEYIEERIYYSQKAGTLYGIHDANAVFLSESDLDM